MSPLLLLTFSPLFLNACNSVHAYNDNFGLVPNPKADELLAQEEKFLSETIEVDVSTLDDDPSLTTELTIDPDAFTAEEYVQKPVVYSYKYNFDNEFYKNAEWKSR